MYICPGVGECASRHANEKDNFSDNSAQLGINNSSWNDTIGDAYKDNPNVQYVHGYKAWNVVLQPQVAGVRRVPVKRRAQRVHADGFQ